MLRFARPPLSRRPAWRDWLAGLALALCLVVAQQHASLHWLSHALEATHEKAGHHASDVCSECLAVSAFGGAVASTPVQAPAAALCHALVGGCGFAELSLEGHRAYWSRAPPVRA